MIKVIYQMINAICIVHQICNILYFNFMVANFFYLFLIPSINIPLLWAGKHATTTITPTENINNNKT